MVISMDQFYGTEYYKINEIIGIDLSKRNTLQQKNKDSDV